MDLSKQQPLISSNTYSHVKHFLIKGPKGNKKQFAQILANSASCCLSRVVIMKALLQVHSSVASRKFMGKPVINEGFICSRANAENGLMG